MTSRVPPPRRRRATRASPALDPPVAIDERHADVRPAEIDADRVGVAHEARRLARSRRGSLDASRVAWQIVRPCLVPPASRACRLARNPPRRALRPRTPCARRRGRGDVVGVRRARAARDGAGGRRPLRHPHIRAQDVDDLYVAWGFVTARDRLWEMEVNRRAARDAVGMVRQPHASVRTAAPSCSNWSAGRARSGRASARDAVLRGWLERYASGVNAYLAQCRSGTAPWPREMVRLGKRPADWEPADTILLLLAQGVLLDLDLPELEEADSRARAGPSGWPRGTASRRRTSSRPFPTAPHGGSTARAHRPPSLPAGRGSTTPELRAAARARVGAWLADGDPDLRASNVFAVGGGRSASRKPLLANDPHLALGSLVRSTSCTSRCRAGSPPSAPRCRDSRRS